MRKFISTLLSAAILVTSASVPLIMIRSATKAADAQEAVPFVLSAPALPADSEDTKPEIPEDAVSMEQEESAADNGPAIPQSSTPTATPTPAPTDTPTTAPTVTPTPTPTPSDSEKQIEEFITRFYKLCLNREPDKKGLQDWKDQLLSGSRTGSDIAYGFVFSKEFSGRNFSNEEYVSILYSAFFDRKADTKGLTKWVADLDAGLSRMYILHGFVESQEFSTLCDRYGIIRGDLALDRPSDANPKISAFVIRFYRLCLGREADSAGLDNWVSLLVSQKSKGADVAMGFVFSDEFVAKNVSNEEFVNILYKAFFNRTPDKAGKTTWMQMLENGAKRRAILAGFVNSPEFANLSKTYGIDPGYLNPVDVSGDPSADLASYCRFFIGVPYKYGSSDPAVGFDCSGFVKYIYQTKYGIELEHGSYYMCDDGVEVSFYDMQPGDILCYADNSGYYYHVALYIGDGRMVHASTRRNSIEEDPADGMGMPGTVRRILPDGEW